MAFMGMFIIFVILVLLFIAFTTNSKFCYLLVNRFIVTYGLYYFGSAYIRTKISRN